MTVRTLIVDDEPQARKTLRIRLADHSDFEVVGERSSGTAAVDAIRALDPDLVFLDIQMPDLSGFDALRALDDEELPYVVFVTAYDEYALEAFRVNALAYLLKPFDDIRFNEVLDRCRQFFRAHPTGPEATDLAARIREVLDPGAGKGSSAETQGPSPHGTEPRRDRILVRTGSRTHLVPLDEIDWIEAEGNYARLHCDGGDAQYLVREPLGAVADSLDPARFVRIHRSAVVNLDRVRELRTEDHRDFTVVLDTGQTVRLSRTYRAELERALGERI